MEISKIKLKKVLKLLKPDIDEDVDISPFKNDEDGADYSVWRVTLDGEVLVLKKAKGQEIEIYSTFFAGQVKGAPEFLGAVSVDGENYFLMSYVDGKDLRRCDTDSLKKALDALIELQKSYWNSDISAGISYEKSFEGRRDRGKYLNDDRLERAYGEFLSVYQELPRSLCHDDLLPFNVLVDDERATIIDWEVAGILPYPTSLARLIAHTEEDEDAFFYMKEADKEFAINYYYDNLIKNKGISYNDYRYALDLFLLYEYCEWVMLGVKYEDADMERYERYLAKAKQHLKRFE